MNQRLPANGVALVSFFHRAFSPHKLTDVGEPQRQTYLQAITWLERLLKRPPQLADVTPENAERVQRLIMKHGFTRNRARIVKTRLSSLAKHAWRLGLVESWKPIPIVPKSRRRRCEAADGGTLAALVEAADPARRNMRRVAVRAFDGHLGRASTPADVCAETLDAFVTELAAIGRSPDTCKNYRWLLRSLVWGPSPGKKAKAAAPPPPAGSLLEAVENLPRKVAMRHRFAVLKLGRFLKRPAMPADVASVETMAAFREWILATGFERSTFQAYRLNLRKITRLVAPGLLPDARRLKPLPPPPPGSVRSFFEAEYRPTKLIGADPKTAPATRRTLRLLIEHVGHEVMLSDLQDGLAAEFLTWLLEVQGLRAVSVNGHRARLFAVWRFAVERGRVDRDPRVRKLREVRDSPDSWDEDETRRIIDAPCRVTWRVPCVSGIPKGSYFRALLLVAYWTGLRRRSLFSVRLADVDLETGWLAVPGDAIKNRRGQQFRLGADAIEAIRLIAKPDRERLFPWPYGKTHFHSHMRRIFREAKVRPSTRRVCTQLHKMRRTTATLAAKHRGLAAASELLGHSDVEVTKRYIDPSKLPGSDATEYLPTITSAAESLPPPAAGTVGPTDAAGGEVPEADARDPEAVLAEARQLLSKGQVRKAAWNARLALERTIVVLARQHRCRGKGLARRTLALRHAGVIDSVTVASIRKWGKITNKAAHGEPVSPEAVAELLEGAAAFYLIFAKGGPPMK